MVFDKRERNDTSVRNPKERLFHFYDRSSHPKARKFREKIERVLRYYPSPHVNHIMGCLESRRDHSVRSAFFELHLFETLINSGFKVVEVHPTLKNGKTPDFMVRSPNGEEFYVEAKETSWGDLDGIEDTEKRRVINLLMETRPSPSTLVIHGKGDLQQSVSPRKVRDRLFKWGEQFDREYLMKVQQDQGVDAMPEEIFDFNGWELHCKVYPNDNESLVRAWSEDGEEGGVRENAWREIRNSIIDQAEDSQLRAVDRPTILAVNVRSIAFGAPAAESTLVGQRSHEEDKKLKDEHRTDHGLWSDNKKGEIKRDWISGVWYFHGIEPGDMEGISSPRLYFNPWAKEQLPEDLKRFRNAFPKNEQTVMK